MIWIYILIFIPLITAIRRRDEPSYRSSVMPGNIPIVLLYAKAKDNSEFDSGEDRQTSPTSNMKAPLRADTLYPIEVLRWLFSMLHELPPLSPDNPAAPPLRLRSNGEDGQIGPPSKMKVPERTHRRIFSLLRSLINNPPEYLYSLPQMLLKKVPNGILEDNKPVVRMPSGDTDDSVTGFKEENKSILGLPSKDDEDYDTISPLRTRHKKKKKEKKKLREQIPPDWVKNLKDFFKDLTNHYGLEEVLQRAKPVIRSIEKKQHVKVKDVDVDEFGEIHITYTDKNKKTEIATRQGNMPDDTDT